MILESQYNFGDTLYLKTDKDQLPRILTKALFNKNGSQYELSCGAASSWHYDFELSKDKKILAEGSEA